MNLRRGEKRRGRVGAILTTVGALVAFQALAIAGAGVASAVGTCNYNPATDTINITINSGSSSEVTVDETTGAIEFDGAACGSATNSNTVAIVVLGQPSANEFLNIDEETEVPFNTAIAWSIDLGTGGGDGLGVDLNGDQDNTLVLTNTSFNLNGAVGEFLGVEGFDIDGDDGDDVIDGSATSLFFDGMNGGDGDDVLSPGTFADDAVSGGAGEDTLSYSTRTTALAIVNGLDAGLDANGDGDNDDPGDEEDAIDCFDTIIAGSGNDFIDDDSFCGGNIIAPGAGDDEIDGGNSTLDLSSSTGPVTIDVPNQTATGQGTDTWTGVDNFIGSDFDDVMLVEGDLGGPDDVVEFSGGGGVDTVDGSGDADGIRIDLDQLDPNGADDLENAIGGPGNDALRGNDLRNELTGNDGDDTLRGRAANDTLFGGGGNDAFEGGDGADTVNFRNSPAGVTVDLSLSFATGEGDDSFDDTIEIIVGSNFNDSITGGPFSEGGTVNFLFKGRAGADVLTGFNGNDTLKAAGGNDVVRGGGGDDTLAGGGGNDTLAGGKGFDIGKGGKGKDVCKGVEQKTSCGSANNPA